MRRYAGDIIVCKECYGRKTRHPSGKCSGCRERDEPIATPQQEMLLRYQAALYVPYPEDFAKKEIPCRGQRGGWDRPNAAQYVREGCWSCPIYDWCLSWGIENDEQGIWGGLSRGERRIVRNGAMTRSDVTLVA